MLSVIVPMYNAEKYFDKCIKSITSQYYKNIEIILVDDGSTDNTNMLCEQYAKKDSRIIVIHQTNMGQNQARMSGLTKSKGEYITFVDADDWILPQIFRDLLVFFENDEIDIVFSNRVLYYPSQKIVEKNDFNEGIYSGRELAKNFFKNDQAFEYRIIMTLYAKIFRRELILKTFQMIDLSLEYGEDHLAIITALLYSRKVQLVDKAYYFYRQYSNSVMHTMDYEKCIRSQKIFYIELMKIKKREANMDKLTNLFQMAVVHNLLVGGYSFFDDFRGIYPYEIKEYSNKKIAIYGAGLFGRELYTNLIKKEMKVKYIIDSQWEKCCVETGFDVKPLKNIDFQNIDIIIVAVIKSLTAKKIIVELEKYGIEKEKIYAPSFNIINSEYTRNAIKNLLSE